MSYPHRKLTLFHTLPVDATAAITLAAGGEWLSDTLDVLFGKRDVYPGAVVLPNRSAGDAFVWYSKLFSYLYRFATVWLDTMHWQPQLGRMGMKVEGGGKKRLFAIGSPLYQALVRPIHDWAMTVLARLRMDGTYNQTQPSLDMVINLDRPNVGPALALAANQYSHVWNDPNRLIGKP